MTTMTSRRTVLRNGSVADGTGGRLIDADVLISGGVIEAVVPAASRPETGYEGQSVDCTGQIIAPGFVDIHSHSDITVLAYSENASRVEQGITTEVVGNCGMSAAPTGGNPRGLAKVISTINVVPEWEWNWTDVPSWHGVLDEAEIATNIVTQVGHGSARYAVAGDRGNALDSGDLRALEHELSRAFEAGCVGVSVGLMYAPGENANAEELQLVAATAAKYDATVSAHLRDYRAEALVSSIDELARPVKEAGARLQISHLRSVGSSTGFDEVIAHIEELRGSMDIAADVYPYVHGHTTVAQLLPTQLRAQGTAEILRMCVSAPEQVAAMFEDSGYTPEQIVIMKASHRPDIVGRDLSEHGEHPWKSLVQVLVDCHGDVDVAVESGSWPDVDLAMLTPWVSVASDGTALGHEHQSSVAHPRSWGAFPAAYRHMRRLGISIEEAVRRMTNGPAQRVNLTAIVRNGQPANLAVFDDRRFNSAATFTAPAQGAQGLHHVLVNGAFVMADASRTTERPGARIRRAPKGQHLVI